MKTYLLTEKQMQELGAVYFAIDTMILCSDAKCHKPSLALEEISIILEGIVCGNDEAD